MCEELWRIPGGCLATYRAEEEEVISAWLLTYRKGVRKEWQLYVAWAVFCGLPGMRKERKKRRCLSSGLLGGPWEEAGLCGVPCMHNSSCIRQCWWERFGLSSGGQLLSCVGWRLWGWRQDRKATNMRKRRECLCYSARCACTYSLALPHCCVRQHL